MDELLRWLQENGFQLSTAVPSLDGKIERFDRDGKNNAWFWGVRMFTTKAGTEYILAKVGDWKTDEEFEFRTNCVFTREDKKIITERVKEAQEKAARAKEALQADASDIAAAIVGGARAEGSTEYMQRKNIAQLYGAKVTKQSSIDAITGRKSNGWASQDVLVVPMRDSNGKLWGAQQVTNRGDKYFVTGQRINGCFHLIPEDADLRGPEPKYIVEGYATGTSVHEATQGIVVVAFNAGNLLPVCQAVRAESPDCPIVVCGDDDVWGRRPDGSPYNAGREKATEAAKAVFAKPVFPKFRDETSKPTDWNDLHAREGLDEVKRQLLEVKLERHYIRHLGHRDGTYFYTSSDNKEIVSVGMHTQDTLTNLMPLAYWETLYPGKRGVDWGRAADDLKCRGRERGIFWPENVRGLGVWQDAGRVVVHLGDRLHVDGVESGIHDVHSKFIYQLERTCRGIHPRPLELTECLPIHQLLNLGNYERPEQKYFLGGWIMAARLSGLLDWRPHLWITGESGCGKSTLLQNFVYPMLGEQRIRFTGGTTEPGMRQAIKANAVPVGFDEFEPDTPEALANVKACLQFIRQASSDSGDIVKGSTGGSAMQYKARFCAAVSAIRTLLNSQADRTRFTLVELRKVNNPKQWQAMQDTLKAFTPEYADRYFARLLHMLPVIRANMASFEAAFAAKHSQRLGQQYGPMMAGWAAITSDGVLPPDQVADIVDSVDLAQEGAASGDTDQHDCLQHLLSKTINVIVKDLRLDTTVAQALADARFGNDVYNRELARYGLKLVQTSNAGDALFVASRNPQLAQIFRDSSWPGGWAGSLGRLPGARRNWVAKLENQITAKGTLVPLSVIFPYDPKQVALELEMPPL